MKFNKTAISLVVANAVFSTDLVLAQGGGSRFALEEVVVTARKREESLQDTPISITAFTANDLSKRQLSGLEDLDEATPNLSFDTGAPSSGSNSAVSVFIRGVGQLDFTPTTEPGVGIYVDGVYYARAVGAAVNFLDLERVEVLRGPQGTLFGRNTIGGAIDLVSKRPAEEFGGNIKMTIGNDARFDISGNVDIPFTDNLRAKFSGASNSQDGYVKNNTLPHAPELGDDNSSAVRGALLWTPTENFELYLSADYTKEREQSAPNTLIATSPTNSFPAFHNANVAVGGCATPTSNPECYSDFYVQGTDVTNSTQASASDLDFWGISNTMVWDLESVSIKSITAYRNLESFSTRDGDHAPFIVWETTDGMDQDQFSQELQFSGVAYEDKLQWLVGLYYFEEEASNPNNISLPYTQFLSGGDVDNESKAVFAQATYAATDKLDITLGLRYTEDTKAFTPDQLVLTAFGPFAAGTRILPNVEREEKYNETTPMLNVSYQITDEHMTYFTYSEGYKSGGFTQRVFPPIVPAAGQNPAEVIPAYDPEYVKAYEIGLKSTFLDDRARLNLAIFSLDYTDLQIQIRENVASVLVNAGEATIEGLEAEFTILPTEGLTIQAGLAYTDAGYDEMDPRAIGVTKDTDFANTPEFTFNGSIYYEFFVDSLKGHITPRVDANYRSDVYNDGIGSEDIKQEAFTLVNASLSYESEDENWGAMLGIRNLSDKKYLSNGSSTMTASGGYAEGIFNRGREWSLSVHYNF